jgi:hypothetical protein
MGSEVMTMWTAIRRSDDRSLLVPVAVVTPDGWYGDGALRLQPGDPDYAEHDRSAIDAAELELLDPAEDERLIARWEAQPAAAERRSA